MFPCIVAQAARISIITNITLRKIGPFSGLALLTRENESIGRTSPAVLTVGITDIADNLS